MMIMTYDCMAIYKLQMDKIVQAEKLEPLSLVVITLIANAGNIKNKFAIGKLCQKFNSIERKSD